MSVQVGSRVAERLKTLNAKGIFAAGRAIMPTQEKKRLRILGNFQKILGMLRFDGEYLAGRP